VVKVEVDVTVSVVVTAEGVISSVLVEVTAGIVEEKVSVGPGTRLVTSIVEAEAVSTTTEVEAAIVVDRRDRVTVEAVAEIVLVVVVVFAVSVFVHGGPWTVEVVWPTGPAVVLVFVTSWRFKTEEQKVEARSTIRTPSHAAT
jgi:hypothetical protein